MGLRAEVYKSDTEVMRKRLNYDDDDVVVVEPRYHTQRLFVALQAFLGTILIPITFL